MPTHTISSAFKDDAGTLPIGGTVYTIAGEVNEAIKVPAGSTNLQFDFEFLHAKVNDYCLVLATQSAAQAAAATPGFSEAAAGQVTINVNSITTPAPALTLIAKQPHVFAPVIPGTSNEFTADVAHFYITNSGSTDLWVLIRVGLNN